MQKPSILFQIPWVGFDTPVAVNIWAKNIAQAFSIAGFSAHIQYLSASKTGVFEVGGVNYTGLPFFQSWILWLPKIRNAVFTILRNREINKSRGYNFIAPLGGPYSVEHEEKKAKIIRAAGAKYLHPVLEHPTVRTGISEKDELKQYMCSIANIYDVLMPITTYLFECYKDHGRVKPSLLNPIVVDTKNTCRLPRKSNERVRNFVYTGNLTHSEEIQLLLTSFAFVLKEVPDCLLEVIGGSSSKKQTTSLLKKHQHACAGLGIGNAVSFLGVMPHAEVMKRYCTADAFLLPRPFRLYSRAGFPTKLGEYLITGKPVVVTATGDIPLYLEDEISAYLVNDSSSDSFAERVVHCIQDSNSSDVGERGRKVAQESFSIEASAGRINSFFQENNYYESN